MYRTYQPIFKTSVADPDQIFQNTGESSSGRNINIKNPSEIDLFLQFLRTKVYYGINLYFFLLLCQKKKVKGEYY